MLKVIGMLLLIFNNPCWNHILVLATRCNVGAWLTIVDPSKINSNYVWDIMTERLMLTKIWALVRTVLCLVVLSLSHAGDSRPASRPVSGSQQQLGPPDQFLAAAAKGRFRHVSTQSFWEPLALKTFPRSVKWRDMLRRDIWFTTGRFFEP